MSSAIPRPYALRLVGLLSVLAIGASAAPLPNIVFVLADDLGYGDLSCYNADSKIQTPRLDRLSVQGTRFTDAHAPDSLCTPSRYGILTGRYCFRSRLKEGVLAPWGSPLIEDGRLTVPALLRRAGYATAAIGKWHLGWSWPTRDGKPASSKEGPSNVDFSLPIHDGPIARGFDSFFGVDLPNFPPYCFIENDRSVGIPSLVAPLAPGGINRAGPMVPGWNLTAIMPELTRRAVTYIEARATAPARKPFFLYFSLTAPHYPVVPAPEFRGRSKAGDYGDYVAQIDATVGAVLDALERTGQSSNTLVIFTSDNGPEVVEVKPGAYERLRLYGHSSMAGLRGVKRDAWEGGHRVPFIARWPGHVPAARVSGDTVCTVDLLATVAALTHSRIPAEAGEDSFNALASLLGRAHDAQRRTDLLIHSGDGHLGIREGDWVYIDAPTGSGNEGNGKEPEWFKQQRGYVADAFPGELYNLSEDLPERQNRYGDHPEIVKRLKDRLDAYRSAGRSAPQWQPDSVPDDGLPDS